MSGYVSPEISRLGTLADLTLDPGGSQGGAYGKGSISADGKSGLIGNRSGR